MMTNWNQGLRRISTVSWGLVAIWVIVLLVVATTTGRMDLWVYAGFVGALAAVFAGHRVTCWVIDGFIPPR